VDVVNAERFLSEIERVLQSYEQLVLDETLEVEMINASLPSGGIGKRYKYVDLEKTLHEKICFIQIRYIFFSALGPLYITALKCSFDKTCI
jgi:hypothetical protein